jgi:Bacteriophage HK97-gp10, putative tail-component
MSGGLGITLSVEGLEGVLKNMDKLQVQSQVSIQQAILRYALLIERIAKDKYVPVVTGRLKASIGGQSAPPPQYAGDAHFVKKVHGDIIEVEVGTNVVYAPAVEFGRKPGGGGGTRGPRAAGTTHGTTARRISQNGRHGAFLYPAMKEAIATGGPIVAAEIKAIVAGASPGSLS